MITDYEKRVLNRATGLLSAQDIRVARIGFDFMLDYAQGYGGYYDGQEGLINNAQTYLLSRVLGEPLKALESGGQNYPDEAGQRGFWAPDGYAKQDPWSSDFMSGNNFPKGWTYDALEEMGVALEDIPPDRFYKGLNIDEDCAVAELIEAVAQAYTWWAEDFDYEFVEQDRPKYAARFNELDLTHEAARDRYYELMKVAGNVLNGKFNRNAQLWC